MNTLTKSIASSFALAAALAFSASSAQAQSLVNPGFENAGGFTANPITLAGVNQGWALFGAAGQSDMNASVDYPHSGSYALLEQNAPGNNWNPAGAYQIVSGASVGSTYSFSAWFLTDTGTSYGTPVDLQVGFLDGSLTALGTVEAGPGNNSSWGFGNSPGAGAIPSNDTWYKGTVTGTAPAGSVYAVVYAMFMDNGQTTTENVYFDDALLTAVPEPSSLALIGMALTTVPLYLRSRRKA